MALSLTKSLSTGVSAGYFKITKIHADALTGQARVHVNLYLDKASANGGKSPIDTFTYDFPIDVTNFSDLMSAVYTALKAEPFFSGAADV